MSFSYIHTTILLIDDNDDDRTFYADQLKLFSPDCVVLEAKSGQAGLDLYRSHRIDCIVTEFNLPDMHAMELLLHINPLDGLTRIALLFLARHASRGMAGLMKQYGAEAYFIKRLTSGESLADAIDYAVFRVGPRGKDQLQYSSF